MSFRLLIVFGILLLAALACAAESPTDQVSFHETWNYPETQNHALKLGTGPTTGIWYDCFTDNTAWVLAAGQPLDGAKYQPLMQPQNTWDVGYMKCPPENSKASLWLPFGKHGLNRIRHDFMAPLPITGLVSCQLWAPSIKNLHERGVTLVLQTPQGEATIAFGVWAGSAVASYRIIGIRKGEPGYDDKQYHKLPEIALRNPVVAGAADIWHGFVIDLGRSKPNELRFEYRTQEATSTETQQSSKPIVLVQGQDYTAIKAIIIGALPAALYAGKNELKDNAFFVGPVSFTGSCRKAGTDLAAAKSNIPNVSSIDQQQAGEEAFSFLVEMGDLFFSMCREYGISGADIPLSDLPAPLVDALELIIEREHDKYGDKVDIADMLQGTVTIELEPDGSSSLKIHSNNRWISMARSGLGKDEMRHQ